MMLMVSSCRAGPFPARLPGKLGGGRALFKRGRPPHMQRAAALSGSGPRFTHRASVRDALQIADHGRAVRLVLEPRKAHAVARRELARVFQPRAEAVDGPVALQPGQRVGIAESLDAGNIGTDNAVEMRSDFVH